MFVSFFRLCVVVVILRVLSLFHVFVRHVLCSSLRSHGFVCSFCVSCVCFAHRLLCVWLYLVFRCDCRVSFVLCFVVVSRLRSCCVFVLCVVNCVLVSVSVFVCVCVC